MKTTEIKPRWKVCSRCFAARYKDKYPELIDKFKKTWDKGFVMCPVDHDVITRGHHLIRNDEILPDNARKGCHEYGLLLMLEEASQHE